MPRVRRLAVLAAGLGVAACGTTMEIPGDVRPVDARPVQGTTAPVRMARMRSALRNGDVVGRYVYRFGQCYPYRSDIYWGDEALTDDTEAWRRAAHGELDSLGVTTTSDPGALFDDMAHDARSPAYLLGGVITDLRLRACADVNLMTGEPADRQSGTGRITIRWQLYSTRNRAVVYRATVTGAGRVRRPRRGGVPAIAREAFLDSLARLTTRDAFREAIRRPAAQRREQARRIPGGVPEQLRDTVPLSDTPVRQQADALRRSVVVVETGRGHGSGFYITPKLLLTNAHVVRGDPAVTLEPLNGATERARVLRKHVARDVALLRAAGGDGRPLPIRTRPLESAADVFAIGAPLERDLAASITEGTVSAGSRRSQHDMPLIQADVDINPGNSGGPLLDAKGNVVGISTSGYGKDGSIGVNFFIPIRDALAKLGLRLPRGREDGRKGVPVAR